MPAGLILDYTNLYVCHCTGNYVSVLYDDSMTHTAGYSEKDLQQHLATEHRISPFSTFLREIVYGGNDGIVTTYAVVAGFNGAQLGETMGTLPVVTVLLFGLANLFADASSMGLGNYLSNRSNIELYKKEEEKEKREILHDFDIEFAETVHLLKAKGFTHDQAEKIAKTYSENTPYWTEFMMREELQMENPTGTNPLHTALATFLAFILFGMIPLLPYVLFSGAGHTFLYSTGAAFCALILLGLLRWKITKAKLFRAVGEVVVIGGSSAAIAYTVGTFFRGY